MTQYKYQIDSSNTNFVYCGATDEKDLQKCLIAHHKASQGSSRFPKSVLTIAPQLLGAEYNNLIHLYYHLQNNDINTFRINLIKSKNDDCDKPKLFAAIIKIHDDVNERVYYSYMMEKQFKCGQTADTQLKMLYDTKHARNHSKLKDRDLYNEWNSGIDETIMSRSMIINSRKHFECDIVNMYYDKQERDQEFLINRCLKLNKAEWKRVKKLNNL